MARGSRRGRAPVEEEEIQEPSGEADGGDMLMTGLLIVAFGFIFLGIILTSWTLHKNFDSPFLGMVKKAPEEMVEEKAIADFEEETGKTVPRDEGGAEEGAEEPAEE